ncbi:MAG: hypothetical protein F4X40_04055 [Chloroflexi bacterium]|nr:hypothetical protein [Chloroflexota bacterium]
MLRFARSTEIAVDVPALGYTSFFLPKTGIKTRLVSDFVRLFNPENSVQNFQNRGVFPLQTFVSADILNLVDDVLGL